MIDLRLPAGRLEVLCLGAHCDDIEIGCGGTLCALAAANPDVRFDFVVFSSDPVRAPETRAALAGLVGEERFRLQAHTFRDGFFPTEWAAVMRDICRIASPAKRGRPELTMKRFFPEDTSMESVPAAAVDERSTDFGMPVSISTTVSFTATRS